LVAGVTGCTRPRRAVQVAVVWSGSELTQFRDVVRRYPGPVDVISTRNDIDAFLGTRFRTGNQPDVAIIPQIGLITDYARRGWLEPMPIQVAGRFTDPWNDMLNVDGVQYGAWVKAAHKSLVWYSPDALDEAPPRTWDGFVRLVKSLAAGRPAPLSIGAADGWVLTDWLENLLGGLATPAEYRGLVDGSVRWDTPPVRAALAALADVWATPGAFPDGVGRALITQQEESVIQVVAEHRAAMVIEGDFVAGVADAFLPAGATPLTAVRFPAVSGIQPLLVAGDAAVVFAGSRSGHDLVEWLTEPETFQPWIDSGGYLSPNLRIPDGAYGTGLAARLAGELRGATGAALRFDLSDQLRGSLGGPDGLGIWKILQDFFAEAGRPGAIDRACGRMVGAAAQARREAGP
jgi:ABC-type glycerol-3-phosphate transport system substrate-binding protein